MPLTTSEQDRVVGRFTKSVRELIGLARDSCDDPALKGIIHQVNATLSASPLEALKMAGESLSPYAERLHDNDNTLLAELQNRGSGPLVPLIGQFTSSWEDFTQKRRKSVFRHIQVILDGYMICYHGLSIDEVEGF